MSAPRPTSRWLPLATLVVLLGALGWAGHATLQAMVVTQTVNEGRTVADLAESVGRWASQYGGVHVRTQGGDNRIPGSFLTRSVYAMSEGDAGLLRGSATSAGAEREALQRTEAYHWKNPALIQREVADAVSAAGLRARYRMTARTVLNPDNAATAQEMQALDLLQREPGRQEMWRVEGGRLFYARAVVAQKSCLTCHNTPEAAPEFLRQNARFNGGGGFGYVEGRPAGLISVSVPLPETWKVASAGLGTPVYAALGVAGLALVALLWSLLRSRPVPPAAPAPRAAPAAAGADAQRRTPGTAANSAFPKTRFSESQQDPPA